MHTVKCYAALARIYDHLMDHVDYKKWADYIENILNLSQTKVETILDISCGTGELLKYISQTKYKLIASDISYDMLRELKGKKELENMFVFSADSTYLPFGAQGIDTVLMLYDSINYHTDIDHVGRMLHEVNRVLKPNGIFIFDTVTPYHCKTYFNNEIEEQFWDEIGYRRKSWFNSKENAQYTEFDIFHSGKEFHERHRQRIFEVAELQEIVGRENFNVQSVFDEFTFDKATKYSQRIHFVCRKL